MNKFYHQGDLLIVKVDQKPKGNHTKSKDNIALYGEVTGHVHKIKNATLMLTNDDRENEYLGYVEAKKKFKIEHVHQSNGAPTKEHAPQDIPAGIYKFFAQVEYDPVKERRVAD